MDSNVNGIVARLWDEHVAYVVNLRSDGRLIIGLILDPKTYGYVGAINAPNDEGPGRSEKNN